MTGNAYEPVVCAVCGRNVKGRVPSCGDGSALYPAWHFQPGTRTRCHGEYRVAFDVERPPTRTLDP